MILKNETKFGYRSNLYFECTKCNYIDVVRTSDAKKSTEEMTEATEPDVNYAAVLGTMSIGSSFSHLEEFSSSLSLIYVRVT